MARRFTGTYDALRVVPTPVSSVPLTIAGWMRVDAVSGMFDEHFLCYICDDDGGSEIVIETDGTTSYARHCGLRSSESGITAHAWHHFTGVFETNSLRTIYRNGIAGTPNTTTASPGSVTRLIIGAAWDLGGVDYNGSGNHDIAHLAIWDVVLSQTEITSLSNGISPLLIRPTSLKFYTPLDALGTGPELIAGQGWTSTSEELATGQPRVFLPTHKHFIRKAVPTPYYDETANSTINLPSPEVAAETGSYFIEGGDGRRFDGLTSRLFTTTTPVTAAPITIAGWIYIDSTTASHALACITNVTTASHYFVVRTAATTGAVQASARAGSTEATSTGGNVPVATWAHVAGVFSSTTSRVAYLNGVAATASTGSRTPGGTGGITQINIGALRSGTTTSIATGHDVAHLAVWNVALTANEINALAKAVYPPLIRGGNLRFYSALDILGSCPDLSGGRALSNDGAQALSVSSPRLLRPSVRNFSWAQAGQPPVTVTLDADAAVQLEIICSAQAEAAVQTTAINSSVDASAAISMAASVTTGADVVIESQIAATSGVEGAVLATMPAVQTSLDGAALIADFSISGVADLASSVSQTISSGADITVIQQTSVTVQADVSVSSAAQYSEAAARRASVQAYSGGPSAVVSFLDGLAGLGASDRAHITGTYRGISYSGLVENELQASIDAAIAIQQMAVSSIEAIVEAERSATSSIDTGVISELNIQASLDTASEAVRSIVSTLDAIALAAIVTQSDADVVATTQTALIATADAAAALARSISTLADAIAFAAGERTVTVEALVEATKSITVGLDVLVQTSGIIIALETAVLGTVTVTSSADAALGATLISTLAADTAVQAAQQAVVEIDIATQSTLTVAAQLDTAVYTQRNIDITADTVIGGAASELLSALDAVIEASSGLGSYIDSAVQRDGIAASLAADVGIARYAFSSIEFDLVAAATLENTATADTVVETSLLATSYIDALVFTFNPFLTPPLPPYEGVPTPEIRSATVPTSQRTANVRREIRVYNVLHSDRSA